MFASSSCVFPSLSRVETGAPQLWQCDFCETHRKRSGKEVITQLQISHSSNKSPLQLLYHITLSFTFLTLLHILQFVELWLYKAYTYKYIQVITLVEYTVLLINVLSRLFCKVKYLKVIINTTRHGKVLQVTKANKVFNG